MGMANEKSSETADNASLAMGCRHPPDKKAPLAVSITDIPQGAVVRIEGKADVATADVMRFALLGLLARRVTLAVLDLSGLTYVSSLAMGVLVGFRRDIGRWSGRARIVGVQPFVYEVLQAARLTELFEFYGTVEEAAAAV
jgi:anti-anti-sigma factor